MPRALMSVYDKTNLVDFATELSSYGWEFVASGGTAQALQEAGLAVTPVEQLTNSGEMLGGRVKTLHPAIHAAILARNTDNDFSELSAHNYAPIDMVVVNLYPFQETVAEPNVTLQDAIEQIDIGGVALLRAAAKNFLRVTPLCDPNDYQRVIAAIKASGEPDLALRRDLAVKSFAHTRDYDTAIHAYLTQEAQPMPADGNEPLPHHLSFALHNIENLRYGENPHQAGAYFSRQKSSAPLGAEQLGGKQLSYNNLLDVDAAWRTASGFQEPTVVIIKHLTPIGIASADSITNAYPHALAADPVSAFGGIVAVNRPIDETFVEALGSLFIEVIIAPDFTANAQTSLQNSRKNTRLLKMSRPYNPAAFDIRAVHEGILIQRLDNGDPEGTMLKTVTERAPDAMELTALKFAWKAVQHVKSNAIVLAKPGATVGVGGGLPSRVDAVKLAVEKAGDNARGAALASDAFFPFPDGIEVAAEAGISAVIQPGGSIRDKQVIERANELGLAMVFTGVRHFRH